MMIETRDFLPRKGFGETPRAPHRLAAGTKAQSAALGGQRNPAPLQGKRCVRAWLRRGRECLRQESRPGSRAPRPGTVACGRPGLGRRLRRSAAPSQARDSGLPKAEDRGKSPQRGGPICHKNRRPRPEPSTNREIFLRPLHWRRPCRSATAFLPTKTWACHPGRKARDLIGLKSHDLVTFPKTMLWDSRPMR